jgi:hypothetical protein
MLEKIILDCIRCNVDLRLLRGEISWPLTEVGGKVRASWREKRDSLVARIDNNLKPWGLCVKWSPEGMFIGPWKWVWEEAAHLGRDS